MIGTIIGMIIIGAIAGFLARALVPGKDSMSIPATIILGIVGSFVGGFLASLLFNSGDGSFLQPERPHRLGHRRRDRPAGLQRHGRQEELLAQPRVVRTPHVTKAVPSGAALRRSAPRRRLRTAAGRAPSCGSCGCR
jgi:uncharacterized membrane protein YeaQ/YmgE (transglycosylase-associated protein family)